MGEPIKRPRISADEFETFTSGPAIADLPRQTRTGLDSEKAAALLTAVRNAMAQNPPQTVGNGKVYLDIPADGDNPASNGKDEATRVGNAFIRLLNDALEDAKDTGNSGRLTVYHPADAPDGGYAFAVTLGVAREGKGAPRGKRVATLLKERDAAIVAANAAPDNRDLAKVARDATKAYDAAVAAKAAKDAAGTVAPASDAPTA